MSQPFEHRMIILFTATRDVSDIANTSEFREKLERFLKKTLGGVVRESVQLDSPVDAEPSEPLPW